MGHLTPHRVLGSGQSAASAGISMLSCGFDDFRKESEGARCMATGENQQKPDQS